MTGVCVDRHTHLAQNTSDLDGIAMQMRSEPIEFIIFIFLFVSDGATQKNGPCAAAETGRFVLE